MSFKNFLQAYCIIEAEGGVLFGKDLELLKKEYCCYSEESYNEKKYPKQGVDIYVFSYMCVALGIFCRDKLYGKIIFL
jgi:hypothetical protein